MVKQILVVLVALAILATAPLAAAQDQPEPEEKVFNLIVGGDAAQVIEEDVDDTPTFEPAIVPGQWQFGLTLGYGSTSGTIFEHDNIIYKANDEAYFYGDVEIKGDSAFNPTARLSYNFNTWFALEASLGLSFAEYTASISNAYSVDPVAQDTPTRVDEMGEFDPEHRSILMAITNVNGIFYPFNLDGDGKGRWHPYVTGGLGYAMYSIDSDYTDNGASSFNVNAGLGLVLVADDLVTVRAEALYEVHTIGFEPGEFFQERDSGTVQVPIYEFTDFGHFSRVEEYGSNSLSFLTFQLGFMINF